MGAGIIAPVVKPDTILPWVAALLLAASLFSHTVALRLWLLAAGIVLAAIIVVRRRNEIRALPPIWLPFALWALWAGLSIAWSFEPGRSVKEFRNEVFYTGAALWICYVGAQARDAARVLAGVVACAALAACAISIGQFFGGLPRYPASLYSGPGNHSSALIVLMPCALMVAWYATRVRRQSWAGSAALTLAAVFFASAYTTLNRTIWLAFAVQFVLLSALLMRRGASRSIRMPIVLGVAALGACAVMLLSIQVERQAAGNATAIENDARLALWPEVMERVGERPLTGYGFGRGLLRRALQEELGDVDKYLWHAHNLFLEALVQTGVPGLLLLVLLLGATLREAWRLSCDPDDWTAACGVALLAVVAGMLVRNMTDTLLVRQNALLYWGIVGALLGLGGSRWRASS